MTNDEKIIKNKVGLPRLAEELGNDLFHPFGDDASPQYDFHRKNV